MAPAGQPADRQYILAVLIKVHVQAVTRAGNSHQDFTGKYLRSQVGGVPGLPRLSCAFQFIHAQQRVELFRLARVGIRDCRVPDYFARFPIQGDQPGVYGDAEHLVRAQRRPAVGGSAAETPVFRQVMTVTPQHFTRVRAQGYDIVVRSRYVHDSIPYNGRGLE